MTIKALARLKATAAPKYTKVSELIWQRVELAYPGYSKLDLKKVSTYDLVEDLLMEGRKALLDSCEAILQHDTSTKMLNMLRTTSSQLPQDLKKLVTAIDNIVDGLDI